MVVDQRCARARAVRVMRPDITHDPFRHITGPSCATAPADQRTEGGRRARGERSRHAWRQRLSSMKRWRGGVRASPCRRPRRCLCRRRTCGASACERASSDHARTPIDPHDGDDGDGRCTSGISWGAVSAVTAVATSRCRQRCFGRAVGAPHAPKFLLSLDKQEAHARARRARSTPVARIDHSARHATAL